MATANLVAMITFETAVPIWEQHPRYFRGIERVLAEIERKATAERRWAEHRRTRRDDRLRTPRDHAMPK